MNGRSLQEGDEGSVDGGLTLVDVVLALGVFVLMVGVGASCKVALFRKLLRSPKALKAAATGVCCQFVFMPVAAILLVLVFRFEGYTALGLALAGAMPGGSMSNMFAWWCAGVLELSVFMTVFSTVAAFGLTPLWVYVFSGIIDGVDAGSFAFGDMLVTLALLVVPLSIGFGLNFVPCCRRINFEAPLNAFAVVVFLAIVVLIGFQYPDTFRTHTTWRIVVAAALFFPLAAGASYAAATALRFRPAVRRTIAIEVGFQNLALAFAVGKQSVKSRGQWDETLPFPVIYAIFMFAWGAALVPLMRRQKRQNEEAGIEDADEDLFVGEEGGEEKDPGRTDAHSEEGGRDVEDGGGAASDPHGEGTRDGAEALEEDRIDLPPPR